MKRANLVVAVVLFLMIIGLTVKTTEVEAVENRKCAISSLKDAKNSATAIFVGKVLSVTEDGDNKIFEVQVDKYWKGKLKKRVKVGFYETMQSQAWYETGKKYLFFVKTGEKGVLFDYRCSRTKELSQSAEDISKLGKAKRVR